MYVYALPENRVGLLLNIAVYVYYTCLVAVLQQSE